MTIDANKRTGKAITSKEAENKTSTIRLTTVPPIIEQMGITRPDQSIWNLSGQALSYENGRLDPPIQIVIQIQRRQTRESNLRRKISALHHEWFLPELRQFSECVGPSPENMDQCN
jgi:hypothetical protein